MSRGFLPAFRDLPVRRKLLVAIGLSSALALLLATGALVVYELVTFRAALVRKASTEAALVGNNAAAPLLFDDRAAAMETLAALRADPAVVAAAVYRPDGTVFAQYFRSGVREAPELEAVETAGAWHRFTSARLVVSRHIRADAEAVGSVRIVTDLSERDARLRGYLAIVVAALAGALLASFLLSLRLSGTITGPILHLVDRARLVSEERNYSVRATPAGADEVGLLVRTFNEMLSQIEERDAALRRARDEAESANRAKDEFLAVVSHELRTPLTPIISWTRMLRSSDLAPERRERAYEVIERNARAQAQLIDDLLDVSRIIAGKVRLDVQSVEPAPLVDAALDAVRPAAEARGIRVHAVLDHQAGAVTGDPQRLQQVFWNLLSNAVKFTPRGGRVEVRLARVDSHVEVSVSDTGQGIRPEFLPYVFDRFRQADSSTARAHGGLGIGLAIVRHIVELHGGRVRAASEGDGRGATFTVELPVALLHPAARADGRPGSDDVRFVPAPVLTGLRVLAVDDEPDTLDSIRTVLEACGAEVRAATSAAEGLRALEDWRPDVLISDIGMPGEDGFAFIRRVRALPEERGGRVPALALTAYARVEDRVRVLSAGFQTHAPKPIEPAELVALVGSVAQWSARGN